MSSVFVYVVRSEQDGSFYVGMTSRLQQRIKEHNAGSSAATRSGRPWQLVYHEECGSHAEGRRREKQLKSGGGRRWLAQQFSASGESPS